MQVSDSSAAHAASTHPVTLPWLTVVGIGEDGWAGLGAAARAAIAQAEVLFGGARHLALIPERSTQSRTPWPSPFAGAYELVLAERGRRVCVLVSGDPMLHGMGATLAERVALDELHIIPAPSSVSLAAARLGWALHETTLIPAHGCPLARVNRELAPGARLLVLSANAETPARLARLLCASGYGASRLTLLERLGGAEERSHRALAREWPETAGAALNLVALECCLDSEAQARARGVALPDAAFHHDGQLTKRDIRAATLTRLAPLPGELLWDVGAGSGSIGIEWLRAEPRARAIAIESHPERQGFIRHNREALGVPELELVCGRAPEVLNGLECPDVIFIGGGLTVEGVAEHCWQALRPGGRLIANAVTLQTESFLVEWRARIGGELTRLSLAQTVPLGRFDGWRSAMPVTLFVVHKAG